jgi:hypothetical protein
MKILLSRFINNRIHNSILLKFKVSSSPSQIWISSHFPPNSQSDSSSTSEVPKSIVRMNISQLVGSIDAAISNLTQGGASSDADRQELLAAATRLQAATESPLASVTSIVLGVSCDVFWIRLVHHG